MNHSELYDSSNTRQQLPHLGDHLNPLFQYMAFVLHDSNLHAVHPVRKQEVPTEKNLLFRGNKLIM